MPPPEASVYRPYALLAFGAVVCVGTPLGIALLAAHAGATPAMGLPWVVLHGHVQIIGFFGTLIVGIAPHLLARVTGRPLPARPAWTALLLLGTALMLRVAGTAMTAALPMLVAVALETGVFTVFAVRVWRALDAPPARPIRRHLTAASAWLVAATAGELVIRAVGFAHGTARPTPADLHELHVLALFGGVLGWVLGVLLRAGPMVLATWAPPGALGAAAPWLVAVGALLAAGGGGGHGLIARIGELIVLATATTVVVGAGVFRRGVALLPLAGGGDESRLVKLAIVSLVVATGGAVVNVVAAARGTAVVGLPDAVFHLLAIGTLGGVAVAVSFRLIPVLEGRPLPFPSLPRVALLALGGAVIARTAQILSPVGLPRLGTLVTLSGALAWLAFACVAVTLAALAVSRKPGAD